MRPALLAMRHAYVRVLVDRRRRRVVQFASSGIACVDLMVRFDFGSSSSSAPACVEDDGALLCRCATPPKRRALPR